MESFSIDGLRLFRPVNGSYMLVKTKTSDEGSEAETAGDTTTVTTADGKVTTHSRHHASDDFPTAVVPVVAIVFTFIWLIIKALMAPFTQRARRRNDITSGASAGLSDEEQAVLVKLQRTLTDMEQRIESLETILIDEHRTKEKYGTKI